MKLLIYRSIKHCGKQSYVITSDVKARSNGPHKLMYQIVFIWVHSNASVENWRHRWYSIFSAVKMVRANTDPESGTLPRVHPEQEVLWLDKLHRKAIRKLGAKISKSAFISYFLCPLINLPEMLKRNFF